MKGSSNIQRFERPPATRLRNPAPHLVDPRAVQVARAALCGEDELTLTADTFQILANPTRLQIVGALSRRELCVGDLAAAIGASVSAVSHHLRQLRQMRLVRHRRAGKLTFYALDDAHVAKLFDLGLEHVREELE
jgi:ArsR family transcriptional regulator